MIAEFIFFTAAVCAMSSIIPITWIGGLLIFGWMERMVSNLNDLWRSR